MEPTPKYRVIMNYIEAQIQNNTYAPNTKLPTEQKLSEQFGTSRPSRWSKHLIACVTWGLSIVYRAAVPL